MTYVQPNSIVQLFKGINLDNRYMHTIYFASESAQNTWFTSKVTYTFQQISYTRYTKNSIKLKADTTDIIDCTYLRFKNDRNVDKWFYAFINSVEYVNENTCLITYEIDVMQTWFMQGGSIRPCMVLREHVNDDSFGANLEAEPCGGDSYTGEFLTKTNDFDSYSLLMFTSENPLTASGSDGVCYNNDLYNGTALYVLPVTSEASADNITTAINALFNGDWDAQQRKIEIIDMFTFPTRYSNSAKGSNMRSMAVTDPKSFTSYTPKNKKLLTYPFNYLYGTTMNGECCIYKWELFDEITNNNNTMYFNIYGNPIGGGSITCYPQKYAGVTNNHDMSLNMSDFPKNPFIFDAYQAWIASGGKTKLSYQELYTRIRGFTAYLSASNNALQSGTAGIASAGRSAYSMEQNGGATANNIAGMVTGVTNAVQGGLGLVNTAVNVAEAQNKIVYAWNDAHYQPNVVVGDATPNLAVPMRSLDFNFFNVHLKDDEAKRVDDFFSCYGYAINRVKQPNITGRQYWNFVQTQNSVIAGNMPSSSKEAIARIFDGGITFWHNGDNVGNYAISTSSGTINNPIV